MRDARGVRRWRPTRINLVAGGLVLAGFLLADVHWGFIVLVGLGTFGPGLLRELGWLRDKDEFQLAAARRAGYHGFLAAGLLAFLLTAYYRLRPDLTAPPGDPVELLLAVLWFTWLLSSLLAYWGARRMAVRLLIVFGCAWLLFNVVGNVQAGPVAVLMQSLLAAPFFLAAWLAVRLPRLAGAALLGLAVFFVIFFGLQRVVEDPFRAGRIFVLIFFIGPLLTAGLGLLQRAPADEDGEVDLARS
jgi:hypothetical protein